MNYLKSKSIVHEEFVNQDHMQKRQILKNIKALRGLDTK